MLHRETYARFETLRDVNMPIQIDSVTYYSVTEVIGALNVLRQTLWRWRNKGKVPAGHRYGDRDVLFTSAEVETIRRFANRIEPI